MKNRFIIMAAFCAGVFFSCSKDDVVVQNNTSLDWQIDDKLAKEDDIRARLGYDPRYNYVYLANDEIEVPMLSLTGLTLTGNNIREISVQSVKELENNVKLTLEYDADAFANLSSKYIGYELGEANLVTITESEKTFAAGTTSGTFEISVANDASITKKLIIPLTLKVKDTEDLKTFDTKKNYRSENKSTRSNILYTSAYRNKRNHL